MSSSLDVFRPCFHPVDECLAFAFAEIFVRVVKVDANPLVEVLAVSDVARMDWVLNALLGGTETGPSPTHFTKELMTLVRLVQPRVSGVTAIR